MPISPGAILHHRYRIETVLGQGGMGAVYRATDVNLGVPVAVKENLFTTEEYARQFHREATILAGLRHPNLPRVTDHFVIENEGQYLVMDYIQGDDLRQILERSGPIVEHRLLPWALEICDALAYLHSRKPSIVHRDVKPGNLKITPDDRALLVDFGLAKIVHESGSTTVGAKAMTPGFSPPEQYGTGRTDPRSDVYSLGATLYAALTLSIPEDALERMLGRKKLTPLSKRNPRVTQGMARAIEKALEVKPEDRYASMPAFAAALAASANATRPTAVPAYPHLQPTVIRGALDSSIAFDDELDDLRELEPKRRRWPIVAAGGVVAALVVLGGLYAWLGPGTAAVPASAGPPTDATAAALFATEASAASLAPSATPLNGSPGQSPGAAATALPGGPALLATSTGGGIGQIAFASARTGLPQIFLMNADGTDPRQLTNIEEGACQPSWSPDGSRLMFTTPCRRDQDSYPGAGLVALNVEDGSTQALPSVAGGGDYDPDWGPDGERVAFTSLRANNRPHVFVMDLSGANLVDLSAALAREAQPVWSPTGTQLALVSSRAGNERVFLVPDFGGEGERFSWGASDADAHPDWSADGQWIAFERVVGNISRLYVGRYDERGKANVPVCAGGQLSVQPMADPDWSPDGRWLVFETWPDGKDHNIAIMTSTCTNYAVLTQDPGLDFDPAWRP